MKYLNKTLHLTIYMLLLLLINSCALSQAKKDIVYITKTGSKYHRSTCHYLKYSKFETELKEARQRGYTACSVCKPSGETMENNPIVTPDENKAPQQVQTKPSMGQSISAKQCTATTKADSRCKRTTTNSNGLCWQHQ